MMCHTVLFAAELPEFRKLLPSDMQEEMLSFSNAKKAQKSTEKAVKQEAKRKMIKKDKNDNDNENGELESEVVSYQIAIEQERPQKQEDDNEEKLLDQQTRRKQKKSKKE